MTKISPGNGFTLVEIAIVIVVVGLLVGGALKSQEMITNSKIKRIVSDNAGISVAIFAYQDRYLQFPGDDNKAAIRFSSYTLGDPVNGDGSGTIDGNWDAPSTGDITAAPTAETNLFFAHLRAAGLLSGSAINDTKPTNAYGGQIGIKNGALGISGHVIISGQIEGPIARILEARLDDKEPSSGRIQSGISSGASPIDMNTAATGSFTYNEADRYNMAFQL